ncbi:MAG TPA: hypothetical protein VKV19_04805 [Ktedonobacteraceae bacterium]|nr:hypothetical protein [Ktedonobacteraceae bacterium]
MNSFSRVERPAGRKPGHGCLGRVLLVLVVLGIILVGVWFLAVRPYLHNIAQERLDLALGDVEGQVLIFQLALPPGNQVIHANESSINNYLGLHDTSQIQNLHATITPDGLILTFTSYGFGSTITLLPVASGGTLQVTDVQVQGLLWLVMSDSELTSTLNSNLQSFGVQMHRSIQAVTLHEHEMDIQIK